MIHAIGDVHGQRAELERALTLIDARGEAGAGVVFLGDYVDRGPDSRGVIDHLIAERGPGRVFLRGNHDRMFLRLPSDRRDHGALVVHGHTAFGAPTHDGNRLDVDGGAAYGRPITAALIDGRDARALDGLGRRPL